MNSKSFYHQETRKNDAFKFTDFVSQDTKK